MGTLLAQADPYHNLMDGVGASSNLEEQSGHGQSIYVHMIIYHQ
jgi:hypothetical protein